MQASYFNVVVDVADDVRLVRKTKTKTTKTFILAERSLSLAISRNARRQQTQFFSPIEQQQKMFWGEIFIRTQWREGPQFYNLNKKKSLSPSLSLLEKLFLSLTLLHKLYLTLGVATYLSVPYPVLLNVFHISQFQFICNSLFFSIFVHFFECVVLWAVTFISLLKGDTTQSLALDPNPPGWWSSLVRGDVVFAIVAFVATFQQRVRSFFQKQGQFDSTVKWANFLLHGNCFYKHFNSFRWRALIRHTTTQTYQQHIVQHTHTHTSPCQRVNFRSRNCWEIQKWWTRNYYKKWNLPPTTRRVLTQIQFLALALKKTF